MKASTTSMPSRQTSAMTSGLGSNTIETMAAVKGLTFIFIQFRSSYAARVDVAVVEYILRGHLQLYRKICREFADVEVDEGTVNQLARWDEVRTKARSKSATAEGKQRRADKKARKTRLLQRHTLRADDYIYSMSLQMTRRPK